VNRKQSKRWILIILAYAIVWILDLIVYLLLFVPGFSNLVLGILNQLSGIINLAFAILILFVSDHRIHEAKKMLSDPLNNDKTILNILYDAGFNSKSSFNDLFKKKTGMTPSEFRKNPSEKIKDGR
jgi:hypothetical protein